MRTKARKKQRKNNNNNDNNNNYKKKKQKLGKKPILKSRLKKKKHLNKRSPGPSSITTEKIQTLLEPYSKDQLIDFLCDAAVNDQALLTHIRAIADLDVSHRKIFVYGLGWDTTQQALISAFQPHGELEDCTVVVDRATGNSKGYGFVLFKSRTGAANALKQPQKMIGNRVATCQLASIGSFSPHQSQDTIARKIYVSNVHRDADPQKLRAFFGKFGELETGPLGFDISSGKSRGFALFVYKTVEGAKKALEEPIKMFEGHQLHCRRATENKNKAVVQQQAQQVVPQGPMLAAMAAAQNLALFSQYPSLNPAYSALAMNQNVNPFLAGALNPSAIPTAQIPGSSFGAYGASPGLGVHGSLNPALQGLQAYHGSNVGQLSSSSGLGMGGSLPGYSSYWR